MTTWLKEWAEYSMPLGEPQGDANVTTVDSTTLYHRSFSSGTRVVVNITMTNAALAAAAEQAWEEHFEALAAGAREDPEEKLWLRWPGGPEEGLTGTLTTSCIYWSDGNMTGSGCY